MMMVSEADRAETLRQWKEHVVRDYPGQKLSRWELMADFSCWLADHSRLFRLDTTRC